MTERVINLTLPMAPPVNNLYATIMVKGRPVRIPSKESKVFKKAVADLCMVNRVQPFIGDVAVRMKVYRPRKAGDLDNYFKAVLDSLKGFAFTDDKQITMLFAERFDDKNDPRVEVRIWAQSLL
jgi:crossover junction endodeoxyribonuclease RusA